MKEQVNHPEHYNIPGRKECWDEFVDKFGPRFTFVWCLMTAQKYLYRKGLKDNNPEEQDLNKAWSFYRKATAIRYEYPDDLNHYAKGLYNETKKELKKYDNH